jgi:hypothetical protein
MSRQRAPLDAQRLDEEFGGRDDPSGRPVQHDVQPHDAYPHHPQTYDPNWGYQPRPPADPYGQAQPHGYAQPPRDPHQHPAFEQEPPRAFYPEHVPADMAATSYVYPEQGAYEPHTPQEPQPSAAAWPPVEAAAPPEFGGYPAHEPAPAQPHTGLHAHDIDRRFAAGEPSQAQQQAYFESFAQPANDPVTQPPMRGASFDDRYDLGSYAPRPAGDGYSPTATEAHAQHFGHDPHADPFGVPPTMPPPAQPAHYTHDAADPSQVYGFDPYARGGQPGSDVMAPHAHGEHDDTDYDEYDDDQEAAGGRTRLMVGIAAVLVASVAVGGGLAFGYKQLFSGSGETSSSPVILSGQNKTRQVPEDEGGRRFANTDSKLLDRLDNGRNVSGTSADRTRAAAERVRTVSTHIVRPDGTLVESTPKPPRQSQPAPSSTPSISSPIPGMTLVGVPSSDPVPSETRVPTQVQPVTRTAPATPPASTTTTQPRIVIANAPPTTRSPETSPVTAAPTIGTAAGNIPLPVRNTYPRTESPRPVVRQAAVTRTPSRTAAPAVTASAASSAAGATSPGFVAVLASKPDRMDALATFADLRARYSDVLSTSIPEVQAADLSSRGLGTMYRVVVGPPGSREAANSLCTKLKTAGYSSCWVKSY